MDTKIEEEYLQKGYQYVVGIDEVGRGCWAGPLYLCAYIYSEADKIIDGVHDSKQLKMKNREEIFQMVDQKKYVVEKISSKEIDSIGLGKAIIEGLKNLIDKAKRKIPNNSKHIVLVDGYFKGEWGDNVIFITKGDQKVYSIALASIIAKVSRDNYMKKISENYPEYGFESHVGYGTRRHIEALEKFGVTEIHRKSYKPIMEFERN